MKKKLTEYEKKSWFLSLLCMAAYTTVYIGKKTLSVCFSDMISDGVITKTVGGTAGTLFLIVYAVGQLVNGYLGDRVHPRYMICAGLCGAGCMDILMGVSSNGYAFCAVWAACGFFCSMLWPSIIRAVSRYTTRDISQKAGAALSATIPVGTVLCYLICALTLKLSGWRLSFASCGSVLIFTSVVLFFLFGGLSEHIEEVNVGIDEKTEKTYTGIKVFICAGIVFTLFGISMNGMLKDGLDLWIPTAINEKFISDPSTVSIICTILPVFNIIGVYAAKYIYTKFRFNELTVCGLMFIVSFISLGAFLLILVGGGAGMARSIFATVLLAISSAAMLGANTMFLTFIPLHFAKIGRTSFVSGMFNSFSYASAALSGLLAGAVSDNFGWEAVFTFFIIVSAAASVLCFAGHRGLSKLIKKIDGE